MYLFFVYELLRKCTQRKNSCKGLFSNITPMNKRFLKDTKSHRKDIFMQNSPSDTVSDATAFTKAKPCLHWKELEAEPFGL